MKTGDKVKVLRKAANNEIFNGITWTNTWAPEMDNCVGKIYTIVTDRGMSGVKINTSASGLGQDFLFPVWVLELVTAEIETGSEAKAKLQKLFDSFEEGYRVTVEVKPLIVERRFTCIEDTPQLGADEVGTVEVLDKDDFTIQVNDAWYPVEWVMKSEKASKLQDLFDTFESGDKVTLKEAELILDRDFNCSFGDLSSITLSVDDVDECDYTIQIGGEWYPVEWVTKSDAEDTISKSDLQALYDALEEEYQDKHVKITPGPLLYHRSLNFEVVEQSVEGKIQDLDAADYSIEVNGGYYPVEWATVIETDDSMTRKRLKEFLQTFSEGDFVRISNLDPVDRHDAYGDTENLDSTCIGSVHQITTIDLRDLTVEIDTNDWLNAEWIEKYEPVEKVTEKTFEELKAKCQTFSEGEEVVVDNLHDATRSNRMIKSTDGSMDRMIGKSYTIDKIDLSDCSIRLGQFWFNVEWIEKKPVADVAPPANDIEAIKPVLEVGDYVKILNNDSSVHQQLMDKYVGRVGKITARGIASIEVDFSELLDLHQGGRNHGTYWYWPESALLKVDGPEKLESVTHATVEMKNTFAVGDRVILFQKPDMTKIHNVLRLDDYVGKKGTVGGIHDVDGRVRVDFADGWRWFIYTEDLKLAELEPVTEVNPTKLTDIQDTVLSACFRIGDKVVVSSRPDPANNIPSVVARYMQKATVLDTGGSQADRIRVIFDDGYEVYVCISDLSLDTEKAESVPLPILHAGDKVLLSKGLKCINTVVNISGHTHSMILVRNESNGLNQLVNATEISRIYRFAVGDLVKIIPNDSRLAAFCARHPYAQVTEINNDSSVNLIVLGEEVNNVSLNSLVSIDNIPVPIEALEELSQEFDSILAEPVETVSRKRRL
jgi:ribosomal protein L21E